MYVFFKLCYTVNQSYRSDLLRLYVGNKPLSRTAPTPIQLGLPVIMTTRPSTTLNMFHDIVSIIQGKETTYNPPFSNGRCSKHHSTQLVPNSSWYLKYYIKKTYLLTSQQTTYSNLIYPVYRCLKSFPSYGPLPHPWA